MARRARISLVAAALALTGCFVSLEDHDRLDATVRFDGGDLPGECARVYDACDTGAGPGYCGSDGCCGACLFADPASPGNLTCFPGTSDTHCRSSLFACEDCTRTGSTCGASGCE